MPVTAKDIAQTLGISPATVSMVLNNRPGISLATREKILDLARELGYEKQTRIVQVQPKSLNMVIYKKHGDVVSDTPFFAELIQGIEQQTRKSGFNLLVSYFYESQNHTEQIGAILASSCRGIILLATEMDSRDMRIFVSLGIPLVILDNSFNDINHIDSITINNIQGSTQAMQYLVQSGHKRIGHLRSSVGINNFYERREGYLKNLNGETGKNYTVPIAPTSGGAYEDMKKYLASNPEIPSAFFADNDIIAISCIRALREATYRIPGDVSIIGFDDIPASQAIDPPLSTMRVPKKSLGIAAVERLIRRINNETAESIRIAVNTELVIRSSVRQI